jgi:YHS domain-containing protein
MSDDNRDLQQQQQSARRGFAPGRRAVDQSGEGPVCAAPGCTNPGGAFTSERDGRIYQFCSEGCRAKFEGIPQT